MEVVEKGWTLVNGQAQGCSGLNNYPKKAKAEVHGRVLHNNGNTTEEVVVKGGDQHPS
jgi:hypothetical protein